MSIYNDRLMTLAACAAGWATTIPELRAQGLRRRSRFDYAPVCNRSTGRGACEEFFGMGSWVHTADHRTPLQAAKAIEAFVKAHSGE